MGEVGLWQDILWRWMPEQRATAVFFSMKKTGTGMPDIENIMAISTLFGVSIDELLSNEKGIKRPSDFYAAWRKKNLHSISQSRDG